MHSRDPGHGVSPEERSFCVRYGRSVSGPENCPENTQIHEDTNQPCQIEHVCSGELREAGGVSDVPEDLIT
jgi:hypothetical protein